MRLRLISYGVYKTGFGSSPEGHKQTCLSYSLATSNRDRIRSVREESLGKRPMFTSRRTFANPCGATRTAVAYVAGVSATRLGSKVATGMKSRSWSIVNFEASSGCSCLC